MKNIKFIVVLFLLSTLLTSCYDEYIKDNETTATYFSSQKPLRTIVPRDGVAEIEIGAVIAGLRADDVSLAVDYVVDTTLLDSIPEAAALTLMPSAYYTLGGQTVDYPSAYDNVMTFDIIKTLLRSVNVTFDVDAFTSDPLSLDKNYAIPLRIVGSSLDSIVSFGEMPVITSGNITIVVVKYASPLSGTYYTKGSQIALDALNGTADSTTYVAYSKPDLSTNERVVLSTVDLSTVKVPIIGKNIFGKLDLKVEENGDLTITSSTLSNLVVNSAAYDSATNTYSFDINVESFGLFYNIKQEYILVQPIEKELRREEW